MKLLQLSKILVFSVLIGFVFTSCESDYHTQRARLDITPDWRYTDNNRGDFYFYYDVYLEDMDINLNRVNVEWARMVNSELMIESPQFIAGDRVYLEMETDNSGILQLELKAHPGGPMSNAYVYINHQDGHYANFVDRFIDRLVRYGQVRLHVSGAMIDAGNVEYLFRMRNVLDVETY